MAIHLHDRYAKKIQSIFTTQSLIAGKLSTEYDFAGAKTVKVSTPITVPMGDYVRTGSNRYGLPVEMEDTVQELTLTQDKSFSLTIDKGNNADQGGVKEAGKMLGLQIAERAVPLMDTYCFNQLAHQAGTIAGNTAALTSENICERISTGTLHMDDHEVPVNGRTLFINAVGYKLLKHSEEFLKVEDLGKAALEQGVVGRYDNMDVVKVMKSRWPEHVNFIIAHKAAATAPVKLNDTKLHQDPPGISGNLLEGRQYYDLFVFGAKCNGVYCDVYTGAGGASVLSAPAINASTGAITPASGASIFYTTDETDPRYSITKKAGNTATGAAGTVIRAYQVKAGAFSSPVAKAVKA